jgi:TonB family protein
MNLEAQRVPEEAPGFLKSCLVEGDPAQERRARRVKRRALALSILFQFAFLAALVLYPLLGKSERISLRDMTPVPPYRPIGERARLGDPGHRRPSRAPCGFCITPDYNHPIVMHDPSHIGPTHNDPIDDSDLSRYSRPDGRPDGILGATSERRPIVPREDLGVPKKRIHIGTIEPALLTRRVDPVYPALPKQLRREGRVELHAIISTDGSVQSLEIISGDPLFYQSALLAVREWRYRPTILNGQAVEIDTHITVIYSLNTQ